MKQYYSIGEFSKLFGLNVQTLYYYDKIGLFQPEKKDPNSNCRYYSFDQVYQMASIRFMRKLGYSIDQIKDFFKTSDLSKSLESLRNHSAIMKEQWKELLLLDDVIQRKLLFIEQKMQTIDVTATSVRWFPERRYLPIGSEEILYYHDSFYLYPTLVFYRDNTKLFGAYLDVSLTGIDLNPANGEPLETGIIPAGNYLCAYHVGSYSSVEETEERVRAENKDKKLGDWLVNFNIIDQFVESDPEKYITEMQIPIQE